MKRQNKPHWYNSELMKCIFIVIISMIIIWISWEIITMPCTILNTFKAHDDISNKAKYFGNIYSSVTGSFLALIGVAVSLVFTDYKTNKTNNEANIRFNRASDNATRRFKNSVYIGIMKNNYKELSGLNKHIQNLNTYFIKATSVVNNLKHMKPTPKSLYNALKIMIDPTFKDNLRGTIKIVSEEFADDFSNIENTLETYKIFDKTYGYQLKELFATLPPTHNFKAQNKLLSENLNNLSDVVAKLSKDYNDLTISNNQRDIDSNIALLYKYMSYINKPLTKLSSLYFQFGKGMRDYVNNLK